MYNINTPGLWLHILYISHFFITPYIFPAKVLTFLCRFFLSSSPSFLSTVFHSSTPIPRRKVYVRCVYIIYHPSISYPTDIQPPFYANNCKNFFFKFSSVPFFFWCVSCVSIFSTFLGRSLNELVHPFSADYHTFNLHCTSPLDAHGTPSMYPLLGENLYFSMYIERMLCVERIKASSVCGAGIDKNRNEEWWHARQVSWLYGANFSRSDHWWLFTESLPFSYFLALFTPCAGT